MSQTILVSGASGYVASHVIKQLLARGYKVVGTVRNLANKEKYQFLYEFDHAKENLELREADLLNRESWDSALLGVNSVIHVASPIPPGVPKDENDIIKPAVEGTKNIIEACLKNKIKRLVFTSSCLTAMVRTDGKIANEDDWSDQQLLHHYPKSKFLAEKLFWEYASKHQGQLQFVSVLPSLVTGPAFTKHGNSSQALISQILNGGFPGVPTPPTLYSAVDVRDVALAHIKALEEPNAKGKRFIVSGFVIQNDEMFNILREQYGPKGYKITSQLIDAEGIKKSGHGPSLRTLGFLGKKFYVNNQRSIDELKMTYHTAKESILQMAQKQIELGVVGKKQ